MIKVWNVGTGELVREWNGHEGKVETVIVSPDGTSVASCGDDRTVRLWTLETGELVRTLTGFQTPIWDIAFTPDGSLPPPVVWKQSSGFSKSSPERS